MSFLEFYSILYMIFFQTLEKILIYLFPCFLYVSLSKKKVLRDRIAWTLSFVLLFVICSGGRPHFLYDFIWALPSFCYFFLAAIIVYIIRPFVARGYITKDALFMLVLFSFLLLPSIFLPIISLPLMITFGWELILSSYSYCMDTAKSQENTSLRQCLFFLLVNPTLVYRESGNWNEQPKPFHNGFFRLLQGGAVTFLGIISTTFLLSSAIVNSSDSSVVKRFCSILIISAVFIFRTYLLHSGRASIQIALMQLIGYKVPERYIFPYLAVSPADFWRRWNTYVSNWFKRYVFLPLAFELGRRYPIPSNVTKALSLVTTFAFVGFMHDIFRYSSTANIHYSGLVGFSISSLIIIIWIKLAYILKTKWSEFGNKNVIHVSFSRLLFFQCLMLNLCIVEVFK